MSSIHPSSFRLHPYPLILASASPRRAALLREAGYDFEVVESGVDESADVPDGLLPADLAALLAARKADAVAARHPGRVVLGADTVVSLGDRAIGKPIDEPDARRLLTLLAGTTHLVVTAVAVRRVGPPGDAFARDDRVTSSIMMKPLTPDEVDAQVAAGGWRGKAGGYGLQDETGRDDPLVVRQTGCATNVVGLPMTAVAAMLREAGL